MCNGRQSQHVVLLGGRLEAETATTGGSDTITPPSEVGDAGNGYPAPEWKILDCSRASVRISIPRAEARVGKREPIAQKLSSPEVNARYEVGCRSW